MDQSIFVGRHEELTRAEGLLEGISAAGPSSLLVLGEPGAGKTRLLQEIVGRAEDRGLVAAWTTCLPLSTPLPFDPLLNLLSRLQHAGARFSIPERGREGEQIFSAIREAIESLSRKTPVLLVADDLHWSDAATRDMLHYCVARLTDPGLGWLLATRPETHIKSFVHHLTHDSVAEKLSLGGLTLEEIRDLAAPIVGSKRLTDGVVKTIHHRSHGNPFLAVELLRSFVTTGASSSITDLVPETVTEMVEERMRPLDESERDVLACAAVLPEPLSRKVLSTLSSTKQIDTALTRLIDLDFITPAAEGWVFSHAVVRDAVYRTIDEVKKARLHGRAADLLEDAPLAQRAPQLAAAGRHAEAAEAYITLGYEAWLRGGPDDAAMLYGRASDLVDKTEDAQLRLTARVGEVLSLLRIGAADARSKGDRLRAAMRAEASVEDRLSFLSQYAVALWDEISDLDTALDVLDEAHGLMRSVEGRNLGEAAWARAYVFDRAGRPADARPFAELALEVARRDDDRHLEVRALNCLGLTIGQTSGTDDGIAILEQALGLALEEELPKEAGLASLNLSYLSQVAGDEDGAEEYAWEGIAIPHVPPAIEALLRGNAALGPMNRGELRRALDGLLAAQEIAARAGRRTEERILVQRCYVHIMLGELETAERLLGQLDFPPGSWESHRLLEPRGMLLEQWERFPEALSVYLEAEGAGDHPVSMWCLLGAIRVAARLGNLEVAEESLRRFEERAGRWSASGWLLQAARGYLEEARGNRQEASALYSDAASACPEAFARVRLKLRAGFTRKDRAAIVDAIDAYAAMGAARAADRARAEARSLGMRPGRRRKPSGSLSVREREIVELVASGKTNIEIAERLFLSPRTVERHVGNMLQKLGYRSRVELAAEAAAGRLPR